MFHLEKFLSFWIDYFTKEGRNFSHLYEMDITTFSHRRHMIYEFHIKHPLQIDELKFNMIIDENPYLIIPLDRSITHSLIIKYTNLIF